MKSDGRNPAILLDRDGTLIVEKNYLADPSEVQLEANVGGALRRLSAAGFTLVVISNQSGVGRGMLGVNDVQAVHERVAQLLSMEGVVISGWYYCPHHPDAGCACRKPMPGLARRAEAELGLDLTRSYVIGDKPTDMELAESIEAQGLLVSTGYGAKSEKWAIAHGFNVVKSLSEAADFILNREKVDA